MPYIKKRDRLGLDPYLETLLDSIDTVGEVNYVISRILTETKPFAPLNYERANAALGVLTAVTAEYYRRVVAPYETGKWAEHGDLPGFSVPQPYRTTCSPEDERETNP
jgi:hypothetical protein